MASYPFPATHAMRVSSYDQKNRASIKSYITSSVISKCRGRRVYCDL